MDAEPKIVFRPAPRPYIIFGTIWGGLGVATTIKWLSYPSADALFAPILCFSMLLLFLLFIGCHRIQVCEEELSYRSPLGTTLIPFNEIRDAKLGRITLAGGIRSFGFQTVLIRFDRNRHRKPVVINARMFDLEDMLRLIDILKRAGVDATAEGRISSDR